LKGGNPAGWIGAGHVEFALGPQNGVPSRDWDSLCTLLISIAAVLLLLPPFPRADIDRPIAASSGYQLIGRPFDDLIDRDLHCHRRCLQAVNAVNAVISRLHSPQHIYIYMQSRPMARARGNSEKIMESKDHCFHCFHCFHFSRWPAAGAAGQRRFVRPQSGTRSWDGVPVPGAAPANCVAPM